MKKLYITSGTHDYLQRISEDNMLLLMEDDNEGILIHETEGEGLFESSRNYEVLDSTGSFDEAGFAVFNNIPVIDEGRSVFENRFMNRARLIESEPGFVAIRVLRPLDTDTYIIMTLWDKQESFNKWQESKAYEKAHTKRGTSAGIDQQKSIFPRPSYVKTFVPPKLSE
ncbi:antibiotic biosynthesis monooxygenase [Bacillus sp. HMF5848]|uniref:antibiotic biosynthesis monooxygenase family protein n=1 Tax=Bacillus sp. HMF5848 TaxID=2495421 RepID=UPI000F7B7A29|nr:antibiotic biosynthesis monooxygenase [Bacillus sp. HMF5848]RSK26336.1 antibiotic biosynthesis monooxygenase [Bacillus sp. HMF5848]